MDIGTFFDLKLSENTLKGLLRNKFITMTSIQKISIPPAIKNRDILGTSKTGSGKTLCFLVPILEKLWIKNWNFHDGTGGLVICPIRELGIQIFDLVQKLLLFHDFNAKILIGGYLDKKIEPKNHASILIATPGNLIKKILISPNLSLNNLKTIAFDEIDHILNKGFQQGIYFIKNILPRKKQTFVFSATLNYNIKYLAILNLKYPIYCFIGNRKESDLIALKKNFDSPRKIYQFFCFSKINEKFELLISFLNANINKKTIVFFSTRKQVKLYYETTKKLLTSLKLFYCFGKMKQYKRIKNYLSFNECYKGVLLSTDLISRGLDFKLVDWVIHFDCPSNLNIYIHRNGRTGRFGQIGKTLIFLLKSETNFLKIIKHNQDNISRIYFSKNQIISIEKKLNYMINSNRNLMFLAFETFFNYLKFIFFQKDKKTFKFRKMDWERFAGSLGLGNVFDNQKINIEGSL
jgi:ATP-dependent RNA helicase DDX10/DBP4